MTAWKRMPLTILCCILGIGTILGSAVVYLQYNPEGFNPEAEFKWLYSFGRKIFGGNWIVSLCYLLFVNIGELPFVLRVVYLTTLHAPKERTATQNIANSWTVFWVFMVACEVARAICSNIAFPIRGGLASVCSSLGRIFVYRRLSPLMEKVVSSAMVKRQEIDTVRETRAYNRYLAQIHELAADYEQIKAYEQDVGPFLELVVQLKPELPACDEKLADMKRSVIDSANRAIEAFTSKRAPLLYDEEHYRRLIRETGEQYKGMFSFGQNRQSFIRY